MHALIFVTFTIVYLVRRRRVFARISAQRVLAVFGICNGYLLDEACNPL